MSDSDSTDAQPGFGLISGELELVVVGPEWVARFASEQARLRAALGDDALTIEHIGSTSVPGLAAKPIMDIAVAIASYEHGHVLVSRLEAIGYRYRGENGIPRRHYFVLGAPRRTHHLHVLERGHPQWSRHLCFRDRLRTSPETALRYAALKRTLIAEGGGDREHYQRSKSAFIAEIADAAGAD